MVVRWGAPKRAGVFLILAAEGCGYEADSRDAGRTDVDDAATDAGSAPDADGALDAAPARVRDATWDEEAVSSGLELRLAALAAADDGSVHLVVDEYLDNRLSYLTNASGSYSPRGFRARLGAMARSAKADVVRWRKGQDAAAERQRELLRQEGPLPGRAIAESLDALEALAELGLWPGPRDPVSERGVQEVRRRWARIQRNARAAQRR